MNYARFKLFITIIFVVALSLPSAQAQDKKTGDSSLASDSLQDMYIVAGCGLAGAILGLSTLSFVDEPSEHTKNVLTGTAIGIVAGVVVVGYNQANKSQGIMGTTNATPINAKEFSSQERLAYASEVQSTRSVKMKNDPIQLSVNFSF